MSTNESFPSEASFCIKHAIEQTPPVFVFNIVTSVLDLLVAITATVSNAVIVYVIWKNKSLHSPSNTLLGSLAVTDLLVGSLVAPFNILTKLGETNNNGGLYCVAGVICSFIGWTSGSLSFLTVSTISVERYLAIRLHLKYVAIVTTKKVRTVLACLWIFVVAFAALHFSDNRNFIIRSVILTTMALCIGVTVLCYYAIYASVRRHRKAILIHVVAATNTQRTGKGCNSDRLLNSSRNAARVAIARQKKSTLTMFYILISYFLFCVPSFAYRVVAIILSTRGDDDLSMQLAYRLTFSLSLVNSALNPVLYCLRIADLREAVIKFVKRKISLKITRKV